MRRDQAHILKQLAKYCEYQGNKKLGELLASKKFGNCHGLSITKQIMRSKLVDHENWWIDARATVSEWDGKKDSLNQFVILR